MTATTPDEAAGKPLRADAARNRAKVLAGARKAFCKHGLDADMAEVARQAGVGVGTVYRHFPTKDALTIALAADHFEQLAEMTEDAVAAGGEPWAAFEQLIWRTAEYTASDLGMCEVLSQPTTAEAVREPGALRLREATTLLVERAKASGEMRADASGDDVPTIMCGFGKVAAGEAGGGGVSWRRYLRIALDGMRAR